MESTKHNIKLTLTPQEWIGRHTDNTMDNVELNKIYSKKIDTDYMIIDDVNEKIKVVHFTGVGKTIHEHKDNFIKKHWL